MGLFNDAAEAVNQVRDTSEQVLSDSVNDGGEAVNQVTDIFEDGAEQVVSDGGEAVNQVTDTIEDGIPQLVSDGGEAFNYDDGPVVVDTTPSDNNSDGRPDNRKEWWLPKPSEPDNRKEEVPKFTTFPEPVPEPDNRKEEVPKPSEPDNRKEEPPKPGTTLTTPVARPAEAANKYKGIIQLGLVAVAIAGTVGAYLWGKN